MSQETEMTNATDQMEQIIKSNGFAYNVVFCVSNLSATIFKSPYFVCGNNKIQILINLESKKLSISIDCNGSLNNFGDLIFDFFVSNLFIDKSLHFNEKSKLPFETQLNLNDINKKNGWIYNGKFHTTLVIKDAQKDEFTEDKKLNNIAVPKYLHPIISNIKEKVEWQIPELSEWHSSDQFDIKFADVIFILSLENNIYNFSMSFESIQNDEAFIKAKLTINNKDQTKNIVKNIFEYVTSSFPDTKQVSLSELKPEEITTENGWIIDNCLRITVEFSNDRKKLPNLLTKKINSKDQNQKVTNFYKLPTVDYIQSLPLNGSYLIELHPIIDDIIGKIYTRKIRVGKLFVIFSIDIEKKISNFEFENIGSEDKIFSAIRVRFMNINEYDEYDTIFPQNLSKDNASISFDTPFDSKTIKEGGWLFGGNKSDESEKEEQKEKERPQVLRISIRFDINSEFENSSPFDPFEIKENYINGPNKKYDLTFEIPQSLFKSPLIVMPPILFNSRKMKLFMININGKSFFNGYLEGSSEIIMNGTITIINRKDSTENGECHFDSYKCSSFSTIMTDINPKEFLENNSDYIDPTNNSLTLKIALTTNEDSNVYLPSEPTFEKYMSYENENENVNVNENKGQKFMKDQEVGNYVGLINQGATCYMNSMLQALFHLPAFRRIVYKMPTTGNENPEKSIPLNLQRLFCEMQFSKSREACSTENLTKSFGWGSQETFVQHDVEEFCRVLMDNLQNKLKGDPSLENSIKHLFEVKARHAIRCMDVKYESFKNDELLDIALNVKGCRNLEESFAKYIAKEMMTGDNQYKTDEYGLQDAVMSEEFVEFPPVLHLHLKRFIFDYNTMKMTKLNDYFEFPEQIDLSPYLASDSPGLSKSNLYDLYGVLVHSGGVLGGHYNAYLRTSTSKQWYFFNDSHVTPVSTYKAVRANYGYTETEEKASVASFDFLGKKEEIEERNTSVLTTVDFVAKSNKNESTKSKNEIYNYNLFESTKNGYLLIYVRHDDAPILYEPIPEESVPHHLIEYVNEHSNRKNSRLFYDFDDKSFVISFTHDDDIKQMTVNYLTEFQMKKNDNRKEFKINSPITFSKVYEMAAKEYNTTVDQIRIWNCSTICVPNKFLPNSTKDLVNSGIYVTKFVPFFVKRKDKDEKLDLAPTQKLVFLKFFFPGNDDPIQYVKSVIIDKNDVENTLKTCRQIIIDTIGLPNDIQLDVYIENVYGIPQDIGNYRYIENGQILIFQPPPDAIINPVNFEFAKKSLPKDQEEDKNKEDKPTDNQSASESSTEAKPAESKSETVTSESSTEAKPAESKPETVTSESSTEAKPAESKPETVTSESSTEAKPAESKPETATSESSTEAKPTESKPETATNESSTEAKPAESKPDSAAGEKSTDAKTETATNESSIDGYDDDDIPVYHFSDYFDDLSLKTLIGFWVSQKAIEFDVYDMWSQFKPLFKIETPDKILSKLVVRKIIEFSKIDFNFKEDSLLLFNLTTDYFNEKVIQHIDTKYQHTSFENVFKVNPAALNVKTNRLYFLHCRKYNYENQSGLITFPNIMFSFDARSIDFRFALPTKREMNLYSFIKCTQRITNGIDIGNGPFRLIKYNQSKISEVYTDQRDNSREIIKFDGIAKYRFEVVPPSQTESKLKENNAVLVKTCYAQEKQYSIDAFGHPFLFEAIKDELFSQTLIRLKKYIGLAENDNLDSYRFLISVDGSLYTYNSSRSFIEMLDGMKLYDKVHPKSQLLIMSSGSPKKDRSNKKLKRQSSNEIKIYN